ncbi:MAG TPA: BTAD domain-containing putative transcriptional regulator, partial [Caldilineaceae bacterium]|nr:BTAD domain-containing putative transcriptional regulator [Caldilineaceae bacterium]
MSHLIELRLFGHPEVRLHGQPLAPALPHKALALLYHVALAEQPVGRETLATLLWPDAPVQTAKHSLRNLLSLLRKALGDELEITQRTIGLSVTDPRQIDVLAFEQGLATLQKAQQQAEAPDLAQWQTTLDLYRGDFLEGFYIHQSELFEEWTALHREYLRSQLITNLLALSEAYAANAAPEAALACLDRLLTIDPENEAAHTQHIQLLLRLGRRTEALQRFERYRQLLAAEFGISPSPELTTLLAEVRTPADDKPILAQWRQAVTATPISVASAPVRVSTVPSASPPAPPTTQGIPNNLISPLSAFIGRDQELAFLAQRLADPACSLLTIVGPGGMGKTSLALALGQRLLRTAPNGRPADFPDGIFWVPLLDVGAASHEDNAPALADDPATGEAILRAIAEQIECPLAAGVSSMTQLQAYLRERRLLLIVDNFEHLLTDAPSVALI